jgi:hypothetical protein
MNATRDALAHEIRQAFGVTDNTEDRSATLSAIRNAEESCSCAQCGRTIAPGAPVWRQSITLGRSPFGGWHYRVAPHCEQCRTDWPFRRFWGPEACGHCGRPVYQQRDRRERRFVFCCDTCRKAVYSAAANTIAKRERAEYRTPRPCGMCNETFEPKRADARFCSVACKQRAYRRRTPTNKGRRVVRPNPAAKSLMRN